MTEILLVLLFIYSCLMAYIDGFKIGYYEKLLETIEEKDRLALPIKYWEVKNNLWEAFK